MEAVFYKRIKMGLLRHMRSGPVFCMDKFSWTKEREGSVGRRISGVFEEIGQHSLI